MKTLLAQIFIVYCVLTLIAVRIAQCAEETYSRAEILSLIQQNEENPDRQAMLLTLAIYESSLSKRIAAGQCRPWECDHGRAWGLWQVWRTAANSEAWGSPDLGKQAKWAAKTLRGQWHRCDSHPGVEPIIGKIRAYNGRGCDQQVLGEEKRARTYREIRSRL